MTPQEAEQMDNRQLAKAKEAIEYFREKELQAIRDLNGVRTSLAKARDKYHDLFLECQARAVERRRSGQIEYRVD